jgi:hypothetical protein
MVAVIVITFLTAYIGLLLWFISKHYMRFWVPVVQPGPTGSQRGRYPWARAVRILLSITHFFAFVGVIWWFPFSLAMLLSSTGDPDWGAATSIPSGFTLNLAELPGVEATGFFNQTINGTMTMTVDVLNGVQWFIFSLGTEIKAILGVFVLLQSAKVSFPIFFRIFCGSRVEESLKGTTRRTFVEGCGATFMALFIERAA